MNDGNYQQCGQSNQQQNFSLTVSRRTVMEGPRWIANIPRQDSHLEENYERSCIEKIRI
jgi:hypothetical protein